MTAIALVIHFVITVAAFTIALSIVDWFNIKEKRQLNAQLRQLIDEIERGGA